MELKVEAPYVPLDVTVGDREVKVRINATVDGKIAVGEACAKAKGKMDALQKLNDEAQATGDAKKLRKVNAQLADVLEEAVKAGIGEDGYDAITEACGAGFPVTKADCNMVMVQVFMAIYETVMERQEESLKAKAAHYLAEVEDAQPEPDEAY